MSHKFQLQLKQGSRTIVNRIEAIDQTALLNFFNTLTTMQVSRILGDVYYEDKTLPPMDDFAYYPLVKFFIYNDATRKSMQVVLHNVKLTVNSTDLVTMVKDVLRIDGLMVDSVRSIIWKESRLNGG